MPRERSPNRDKAKEMYLNAKGDIKLKDIAEELGVLDTQIRKWKNQDKWDDTLKGTLPNKSAKSNSNVTNERNSNKSSKVKGLNTKEVRQPRKARPNNKNAVSTHEHESILFDTLDDEEKELIEQTPFEKMKLLKQEIQLYTVRERRMLQRIDKLKDKELVIDSSTTGMNGEFDIDTTQSIAAINRIQNIEEALTRVQEKKQKAIDSLHKYQIEDAKLELEKAKADDLDEDIEYVIEDDSDVEEEKED